jgi:hypothetical protein
MRNAYEMLVEISDGKSGLQELIPHIEVKKAMKWRMRAICVLRRILKWSRILRSIAEFNWGN